MSKIMDIIILGGIGVAGYFVYKSGFLNFLKNPIGTITKPFVKAGEVAGKTLGDVGKSVVKTGKSFVDFVGDTINTQFKFWEGLGKMVLSPFVPKKKPQKTLGEKYKKELNKNPKNRLIKSNKQFFEPHKKQVKRKINIPYALPY